MFVMDRPFAGAIPNGNRGRFPKLPAKTKQFVFAPFSTKRENYFIILRPSKPVLWITQASQICLCERSPAPNLFWCRACKKELLGSLHTTICPTLGREKR